MTPEGFMQILAEAGIHYTTTVTPSIVIIRVEHRAARRPKATEGPDGAAVEFQFRYGVNGPVLKGLEIIP